MNYLSYRINLFKLTRKKNKVVSAISKLTEEARETGGDRKAQEVWQSESFDIDEIDDEILLMMTRYLLTRSNKRCLPTPPLSEKDEMWERSNFTGRYHLTDKGIREVRGMIRRDAKERMELLSYWTPWIGLLIGLIGAITGLVAIIKR